MEQLVFIAVLILFSILDAVAKKKRQQQMEEAEEGAPEGAREEAEWAPLPGADPHRDGRPGASLPPYAGSYRGQGGDAPSTAEGMVPADIWEEIGALARGEPVPEPEPASDVPSEPPRTPGPGERPELPARIPTTSPIRREQVGRYEVGSHPVHASHADYGTDPSQRAPSMAPRSGAPGRRAREVRAALVEGGPEAARRAVILQEVLGKPLAYRDDGGPAAG